MEVKPETEELIQRVQNLEQAFISIYKNQFEQNSHMNATIENMGILVTRLRVAEAIIGLTSKYYLQTLHHLDPIAFTELEEKIKEQLKILPENITKENKFWN